jgi:hypothetical protein
MHWNMTCSRGLLSGAETYIEMEGPMKRTIHKTDLLTLIGMMATLAGIFVCLFFLFTPVTFGAIETERSSELDLHHAMRWIQPVLGQAIVEDALIRLRSHESADADADQALDGSMKPAYSSVQWMVGRVIVELNRSRVFGPSSDEQRIVTIARHAAEQLL